MLRKEDDVKIKCLRIQKKRKQTRLKSKWSKEERKRNEERGGRGAILRTGLGETKEEARGREQTRARREQTLMPPCRPQMLHQLQTSSFLRSPSFPSTRSPQIEKERQGGHMPYSNLPHPVAFVVPHPPRRSPNPVPFAASSFHSLLSTRSRSLLPSPGR